MEDLDRARIGLDAHHRGEGVREEVVAVGGGALLDANVQRALGRRLEAEALQLRPLGLAREPGDVELASLRQHLGDDLRIAPRVVLLLGLIADRGPVLGQLEDGDAGTQAIDADRRRELERHDALHAMVWIGHDGSSCVLDPEIRLDARDSHFRRQRICSAFSAARGENAFVEP